MPTAGAITAPTADLSAVSVADTGIGIAKENMDKLFTPLFTTKAKGMGFGLAIAKRIVEEHKGNIKVKSKVNKGSTFTIIIPMKQTDGGEEK